MVNGQMAELVKGQMLDDKMTKDEMGGDKVAYCGIGEKYCLWFC